MYIVKVIDATIGRRKHQNTTLVIFPYYYNIYYKRIYTSFYSNRRPKEICSKKLEDVSEKEIIKIIINNNWFHGKIKTNKDTKIVIKSIPL